MEKEHRQLLNKSRLKLVRSLTVDASFMSCSHSIFPGTGMRQSIMAKATPMGRASEYIDNLLRRGPEAFDMFVEALQKTNQDHVLGILGYEQSTPQKQTQGKSQAEGSGTVDVSDLTESMASLSLGGPSGSGAISMGDLEDFMPPPARYSGSGAIGVDDLEESLRHRAHGSPSRHYAESEGYEVLHVSPHAGHRAESRESTERGADSRESRELGAHASHHAERKYTVAFDFYSGRRTAGIGHEDDESLGASPAHPLRLADEPKRSFEHHRDERGRQQYPKWVVDPPEFRTPDADVNPPWLLRREAADPLLTPALRHLLNASTPVFYYSDSSGSLRIYVKEGTKKDSIQQLKKKLLDKKVSPEKLDISEKPRFVVNALPIKITHIKPNKQTSSAICGFYLKVWERNTGGPHWWHCLSVYHLIHDVCRTIEFEPRWRACPWVSLFYKKYKVKEKFTATLVVNPDASVYLCDETHPHPSKAVLDAKPLNTSVEAADDDGEFKKFYNDSYFTVDILAVPADPAGWAPVVDDLERDGDIQRLEVYQAVPPCTSLRKGMVLYARKDGSVLRGVIEAVQVHVDIKLPHSRSHQEEDKYTYERLLEYKFDGWNPSPGDSGLPIYTSEEGGGGRMKLVAFHVANQIGVEGVGLGTYASHSIEAVFPQSHYRVEEWGVVP